MLYIGEILTELPFPKRKQIAQISMQSVFPIPDLKTQIHKYIFYSSTVILETSWYKQNVIIG